MRAKIIRDRAAQTSKPATSLCLVKKVVCSALKDLFRLCRCWLHMRNGEL